MAASAITKPLDNPTRSLLVIFVLWKALLLAIATCSPGPGYDTSTGLYQPHGNDVTNEAVAGSQLLSLISTKLTRWDAIYFTKTAARGYLFEQEWAFGWGFSRLISIFADDLKGTRFGGYLFLESIVAIGISHISHWLSVIALYGLTRAIFPGPGSKKLALITACLHILSPAGLFLSAPYAESTFSLLNFTGALLFVRSHGQESALKDSYLLCAGLFLGCATTLRSNGILNGVMFLEEAFRVVFSLKDSLDVSKIRRIAFTGLGGICIGVGFLLPQYIAYQEFCGQPVLRDVVPRVWCSRTFPSIFTFVQEHYWNVGFLRYWTISNIPLFLLAAPMLTIMTMSAYWALYSAQTVTSPKSQTTPAGAFSSNHLLRSLAIPEILLAVLALTSYHVQIITRISSGYSVWYMWVASKIIEASNRSGTVKSVEKLSWLSADLVVKYSVLYALIQGVLYSSFLPPA